MNLAKSKKTLNILLIDDDAVDREQVSRLLSKSMIPLKIFEGATAQDAFKLLQECEFDCAIIDYQLSDTLGSALISKIRAHRKLPTPIIMISGNSNERVIVDVMRDGIFDYLPKRDLQKDELKQAILASQEWVEEEHQKLLNRTRFYQLAEGLPQLIWTCQPNGECDFLNRRWCDYTGIAQEPQLGFGWLEQIHPDDKAKAMSAWKTAYSNETELLVSFRIRRADGTYRWFDTRATPQRDEQGKIVRWLGSNTDITEFEITRQALHESEQHFHAVFDYAPLGMAIIDPEGNIRESNTALQKLLGYEPATAETSSQLNQLNLADIGHSQTNVNEKAQLLRVTPKKLQFIQYETCYIHKNLREIPVLASVALLKTHHAEPRFLLQVYDLSERKRYEQQLIKLAHFDPLTGLKNRAKLNQDIDYLIQKAQRGSAPFALLFGDLDNFKQVNDSLGHEAGDRLLQTVARRLERALRREDSIARIGGDEFIVLLHDVKKYESVATVAEKLIARTSRAIRLNNTRVHVGMSFGIALYPTDGDDAQTLLRNADSALYEAKAKGRGTYQLYRKELTDYVHNRLLLDADLRKALDAQQFELHYQPIIDLKTNTISSLEALIRWQHPQRGWVMPDDFIPYAQENGLIGRIGEWVMNEAIRQAAEWQQRGFNLPVAVNVSAQQFRCGNLIKNITQALNRHHLNAHQLILEITEKMFLENTQDNLEQISELKAMGIKIALDDFGVGYSSLSYILRFAPQYLKIDRSFVGHIDKTDEHNAMVEVIIGLNKVMPMKIIGEGVESQHQMAFLRERGCDMAQGFWFSQALAASEVLDFIERFQLPSRLLQESAASPSPKRP